MSGRPATTDIIPGDYAIAVGRPKRPLPAGWRWVKLTDVARLATGHTPSRNSPEYWDGDIPWIGIKDARVHHGQEIDTTFQTVTQAGIDNSASVVLPPHTVCLSRTASVGYATVMKRAMATSQDFVNWVCTDAIVPNFLMYLLIAEKQSLLRFGKGTTHTTIYFPEVKALHVGIPSAAEQRRIVAKIEELFSDLDAGVAALERAKANLKRYRAAVLKAAVEGKLTEHWRADHPDTEPASELLARILTERRRRWEHDQLARYKAKGKHPPKGWRDKYKEPAKPDTSELPQLPKGWCWATLGMLIREPLRNGHSARASSDGTGVRTLTLTAVTYGDFSEANTKMTVADPCRVHDLWVEPGDIYIERSNTPELVGTSRLYQGPSRFAVFPDLLIRVRLTTDVCAGFIDTCLQSSSVRRYFQLNAKGLAGSMPKIDQATIERCPISLPPQFEQVFAAERVAERLSEIDAAEIAIDHGLRRAARLRQSILKRAFQGRLLAQAMIDEPTRQQPKRADGKAPQKVG